MAKDYDLMYTVDLDYYDKYDGIYLFPDDGFAAYRIGASLRQLYGPTALRHAKLYRIGEFHTSDASVVMLPHRVFVSWLQDLETTNVATPVEGTAEEQQKQFSKDTEDLR